MTIPVIFGSPRFQGIVAVSVLEGLLQSGVVTGETLEIWARVIEWIVGGATGVGILDRIGKQAK